MAASTEAVSQANNPKKRPETLWRLVDAKCSQLKDTVSSARIALIAVLVWTFAIFVALYNHELGYVVPLLDRYEDAISQIDNGASPCAVLYGDTTDQKTRNGQIPNGWVSRYHNFLPESLRKSSQDVPTNSSELCLKILKTQHEELLKSQVQSWHITIPTLGGSLYVFDIGVAGQAGMTVLLFWFFFATRRENHAIRSFVDIQDSDATRIRWRPHEFTLAPKDDFLSAEHYCFAYHAVAQRFMFIFSSQIGPLLSLTIIFISFPFLVCLWNSYTDVRDLVHWAFGRFGDSELLVSSMMIARCMISVVLLVIIGCLTWFAAKFTTQSSVLLNGWYLASIYVWQDDWDETNDSPAPKVRVSRSAQTAAKK